MKSIKILFLAVLCSLFSIAAYTQGLKAFKLPNGLSVFIWEDPTAPDVFGMVSVRTGSVNDPEQYTGLAHYLEHMMFKGTDKIGALDWEKEKPLYEQIIAKYDEYAATTDTAKRRTISKEINQLTEEAAKYNLTTDFSNLSQSIGGEGLNAGTSYDQTSFYNSFPPGEIYKWLELNSERLLYPVFRNFQPELETVYEEYNRLQDQAGNYEGRKELEFKLSSSFPGHPYARSIIGLPGHLKNPQLSKLIKYYNDWYVAGNMALILAGNVNTNQILPVIKETFGRIENRPTPERKQYPENPVKGRKEVSAKISRYPQTVLAFPGITTASDDDIALDICTSVLSNGNQTGLIDKLVLDGDLLKGNAESVSFLERGSIWISATPYYDVNQQRFESLKSTEKTLLNEIKKLQEGNFNDELIQSIKSNMIRDYDRAMESPINVANYISYYFIAGKDMNDLLNYKDKVATITTEQIKTAAKKYFGSDYYAIFMEEGKPAKGEVLEKPKYDPILPVRGAETEYDKIFYNLPYKYAPNYAKMDEISVRPINDRSKLFYTSNPGNDIFTLTLKFGVGTEKMPKLDLATSLMSNAGIMGQMSAQEVKQALSNLGATCYYGVDESYLYVVLTGFESNLETSCNLLTRQILLPKLDEKQLNSLKGYYLQQRRIEKTNNEQLSQAMKDYLLYKDKSSYINRLSADDINNLSVSNLSGEFQRATNYEAEIHYAGSLPEEQVFDILSKNLPLKQGEMASTSPEIKDRTPYTENTVFFLPNSDAKQSTIWFYIDGDTYKKANDPYINAFNQYFGGGGWSSLVFQEIREYRSMAYAAGGNYQIPALENKKSYFIGYVGTQTDKTMDAIDVYMGLFANMPQYPDRVTNIKNFLREEASVEKPNFRIASQIYQLWKLRGYSKSPAETNMPAYNNLTFDDIVKFYNENIKDRPIVIGIVGDPKMIDEKALAKYGKVIKLSASKVFSEK